MNNKISINPKYLFITGRVSVTTLDLVKSGLPDKKPSNSEILFVGYAYKDIPCGEIFDTIFPYQNPKAGFQHRSKITAITQQFGESWEFIPSGWKTICLIEFSATIPEPIKALPLSESWSENENYICLCKRGEWLKIANYNI